MVTAGVDFTCVASSFRYVPQMRMSAPRRGTTDFAQVLVRARV